jgi:flavin-dependent dehydrogenase
MWDVLIAGAGPAGAVAARILARAGRRVLLIDDSRPDLPKVGESLPGATRPILQNLDALTVLESGSHLPCYGNVSIWGSERPVVNDFIHDPNGSGWHLDRVQFDEDLRAVARSAGAVSWKDRVKSVTETGDTWRVHLKDREVVCQWLIDATGCAASIAQSLGATRHRDLPLFAAYRWLVASDEDTETRTEIEAVPNGWWYTARLPRQTRVVIFHTDEREITRIRRDPGCWDADLDNTRYIRHRLRCEKNSVPLHFREAGGGYLNRVIGSRWLATGDAALSFDPISSRGIFNALYTGMKAGEAVHAALTGDFSPLDAYGERLKTVRATYRNHLDFIYRAENRWSDRPFWADRQLTFP